MSKQKPSVFYFRSRSYPNQPQVSLWLVRKEGAGHAGLLWGEVLPAVAAALAEATGLPLETEESPLALPPLKPPGCATLSQQRELFPEAP